MSALNVISKLSLKMKKINVNLEGIQMHLKELVSFLFEK